MKNENQKPDAKDRAPQHPPKDRMIHRPASTRDVLGRDFHALAGGDGKPKHDHD